MLAPKSAYQSLENKLEASDSLVRMVLIGLIVIILFLLVQPSKTLRISGALWMILP